MVPAQVAFLLRGNGRITLQNCQRDCYELDKYKSALHVSLFSANAGCKATRFALSRQGKPSRRERQDMGSPPHESRQPSAFGNFENGRRDNCSLNALQEPGSVRLPGLTVSSGTLSKSRLECLLCHGIETALYAPFVERCPTAAGLRASPNHPGTVGAIERLHSEKRVQSAFLTRSFRFPF